MHREICSTEAARAFAPRGATGRGGDNLQNRSARRVQRSRFADFTAGGKGGHGDDDRGVKPRERRGEERSNFSVLEARDHQWCRSKPARRQRIPKRTDCGRVVRKKKRTVKKT